MERKVDQCTANFFAQIHEEDARKYLEEHYNNILNNKKDALFSDEIKSHVETIHAKYKDGQNVLEEAAGLLNEELLEIIFVGNNGLRELSGRVAGTIARFGGSNHPKPEALPWHLMMSKAFLLDLLVRTSQVK